ncbi:NADH dehydrogenase [Pseudidiomarina indica]|uniref:NADH dehydrogenase n=1 Tax=Pseudidiomarina indica TaxID=1159017 RepID=A0A1G6DXR6_9GAMM|nr:NAD(P)/FAD-dependent oxidoreductase [Pseudidiomarina indica]SDB49902.1 NADH dehydrogenase [Pseudidiomarina indica]
MSEHQIVIVGGGAGGLELASKLGRKFKSDPATKITLVDRNLTHVWKPLLHEVAAGALDSDIDGVDYRVQAAASGFRFQPGELIGLDREQQTITLAPIYDNQGVEVVAARELYYDQLILAIGSVTNDFGTEGAAEHCYFLDSVKQAKRFHHTLMNTFLASQAQRYPKPLRVGIVGAGATGVELAAELHKSAELIRGYGFDDFDPAKLEVILIEAGPRILPALKERIAAAAAHELTKLGVDIRTETAVKSVSAEGFTTQSGEFIEAAIKVWAAGVRAPDFLANLAGLETARGNQLVVNDTLQTTEDPKIFAIGDCASFTMPDGRRVPPRAQAAHQMAECIYDNLLRTMKGKPMKPFVYKDHGSLVSLSNYNAVGTLMGNLARGSMMIEGKIARIMYKSLYRMHQVAVHGYFKTFLYMLAQVINRRLRPRLKLH